VVFTLAVRSRAFVRTAPRFGLLLAVVWTLAGSGRLLRVSAGSDQPKEQPPRFLLTWGKKGTKPGEFHFPIGIAINKSDEVFVTDFYNDRVQKFSAEGKFLAVFAVPPRPGGIALDRSGNLYITHFGIPRPKEKQKRDQVSVHSAAGKFLRAWGKTGKGDGEFDQPGGIAIRGDRVYVADQTNRRVQVFDTRGKFLARWGEYGTKPGQFGGNVSALSRVGGPQFVALDRDGNVYTTEGSVGRIQKFTAEGKFLLAWGDNAIKPGSFGGKFKPFGGNLQGPIAVCIDKAGRLWVSAVCGRIQHFSATGKYLGGFGAEQGSKPGQFLAPHGLALDSRSHLYVVDAYNHRIQKFAVAP
jgi:tripartite motif-containing protein 71